MKPDTYYSRNLEERRKYQRKYHNERIKDINYRDALRTYHRHYYRGNRSLCSRQRKLFNTTIVQKTTEQKECMIKDVTSVTMSFTD
jgi:hypothetical protein